MEGSTPLVFTELSPMDAFSSLSSPSLNSFLNLAQSPMGLGMGTSPIGALAPSPLSLEASTSLSAFTNITSSPSVSSPQLGDFATSRLTLPTSTTSSFPSAFSATTASSLVSSSQKEDSSPNATASSRTKRITAAESIGRLCRICSDKSDGAHFGVDSCRACAAFFRRSIVMKKKYVCRQGGHNCNINKSVRCMCRKCRFVKCLQCGMLPESVQMKPAGNSPDTTDALPSSSTSQSIYNPTPSLSCLPSSSLALTPDSEHPASSASSVPRSLPLSQFTNGVTKLIQIDQNYKMFCSLRRSTEMSMSATDLKGIFNSNTEEMRPTTFSCLNKLVKSSIPMMADFCTQSFPEFLELHHDEKWSVFQNFIASMWNTETIYRTHKLFPNDLSKKVASYTTYIDLENLEEFFSDTTTTMDVKHFSNLIKKNITDTVRRIVRMLSRIEVSELEYAALLGLLMWPPYLPKASEKVIEMALSIRELIFRELHVYYSNILKIDDYAGRLGELMSLYSSLQWSTNRMKEDMEIFKLFDIFSEDSFIYDIIKS